MSVTSQDDSAMVDKMFGYLDAMETGSNVDSTNFDTSIPKLEEIDDINEFKYSKFAATYFQVKTQTRTHTHAHTHTLTHAHTHAHTHTYLFDWWDQHHKRICQHAVDVLA